MSKTTFFLVLFFINNISPIFAQTFFQNPKAQNTPYFEEKFYDKSKENFIWENVFTKNEKDKMQEKRIKNPISLQQNFLKNKEFDAQIDGNYSPFFAGLLGQEDIFLLYKNQIFFVNFYDNILKNTLSQENYQNFLLQNSLETEENDRNDDRNYAKKIHFLEKLKKEISIKNLLTNISTKDIETQILNAYTQIGDYEQVYQRLENTENQHPKNGFSDAEKGKYAYFLGKKDTQNTAKHWQKAETFFLNDLKNKNADQYTHTETQTLWYLADIYYKYCQFDKITPLTKNFLANIFLKNDFFENFLPKKKLETINEKIKNKMLQTQILQYATESFFYQKNYKEAIIYYKIWQKLSESSENVKKENNFDIKFSQETLFHYAWALYEEEKWAECCPLFEKIGFASHPQSDFAFYYAGQAYLKQEDKKQAKEAFLQVNRLTKNLNLAENSTLLLAKISADLKLFSESEKYWATFKSMYPEKALAEKADFFIQNNKLQAIGVKNFDKKLDSLQKNNPTLAPVYLQFGLEKCLEKTKNPQETQENEQIIAYLLQSKNLSLPQQRNLKYTLAERHLQAQNPQLAIPLYQELLDWREKNDDFSLLAHYGLGYGYYQTGQYMLANTHFQLCIVSNVANFSETQKIDAFIRLADGYYMLNEPQKAIKYYEYALKKGENLLSKEEKNYIENQMKR